MASSPDMDGGEFCYTLCPSNPYNCPLICIPLTPNFYLAPPPPAPPTQSDHHVSRIVIVVAILVGTFLLATLCTFIIKLSSRRSSSADSNTHEDHDQTNNPANRTRYVGTTGLEESVINSITVCKYRRGEGVVEGTDCSICLNEFHDDENLRLLPSCSHAFHLPCIDTWLKSHENCPLCRAKVVVSNHKNSPSTDPRSHPDSEERSYSGNSQSTTGFERSENNEVVADHNSVHLGTSELRDLPSLHMNNRLRSDSNLIVNNQPRECTIEMLDDDIKRVRRSVSMDSSAAWMISVSLTNLPPTDSEASSTSRDDEKSYSGESTSSKGIVPWDARNQKTMGNCSEWPSAQERPAFELKRSFSGGGKFLLTRYGISRESVLPL